MITKIIIRVGCTSIIWCWENIIYNKNMSLNQINSVFRKRRQNKTANVKTVTDIII